MIIKDLFYEILNLNFQIANKKYAFVEKLFLQFYIYVDLCVEKLEY